jgi:hypothetical protein
MSATAQIIFAVIGTGLGVSTIFVTLISLMWKSLNQRFTDQEKLFQAKLDAFKFEIQNAIRQEIQELKPRVWTPGTR